MKARSTNGRRTRRKRAFAFKRCLKWWQITEIGQACQHKLGELVPGDGLGRTYAQWIAAAVIQRAMHGDIKAAEEIRLATEIHVAEQKRKTAELLSILSIEHKLRFLEELKRRREARAARPADSD